MMKEILSLFLALCSLLGSAADGVEPKETSIGQEILSSLSSLVLPGQEESRSALPYGEMRYVHYDPQAFYDGIDRMCLLADAGDADGTAAAYDSLYDEYLYIDSLHTLAMLRYDADYNDDYLTEEYTYSGSVQLKAQDALLTGIAYVLETGCGEEFAAHIGRDNAELCRGYEGGGEEPDTEAMELLDEYYALYDSIGELSFTYEGTSWNFDKLYGFRGDALAARDYDAYLAVYNGLQRVLTETFAPLYIRLVELRTEEARRAGYDSFTDYAYEYFYTRDYTPEDAQRFCDAVKPIAREYYADLFYSDISYGADEIAPRMDGDALLAVLGEYLPRIDPSLLEPWEALTRRELYDMAPAASGRFDGGYTTIIHHYRAPFMFVTLEDGARDLPTVTHEFGHFADYYFSPQTNILTQIDDLDLSEIHSNGLQALFTEFYGEIYTEGADVARYLNLADLLENIIDGCLYDEFQRRVMDDPGDLTAEKLNRIYTELSAEYGVYDAQEWDGTWVYISHNFAQPLYYISYAASAMAALQLWDLAQTDFSAAAETYLSVLRHGSYEQGYTQVLEECGLRLFTEEGAVEEVCRPVLAELYALDSAY